MWETDTRSLGVSSMLSFGEYPKEENASTLSQILTVNAPKYYLSPRACRGILNRAFARGKKLPPILEQALRCQARCVCATKAVSE